MKLLILLLLSATLPIISIADASDCPTYERKAWKHWIDEDKDCQNTRHEVLVEESLTPVTFKTDKGMGSCPTESKDAQ